MCQWTVYANGAVDPLLERGRDDGKYLFPTDVKWEMFGLTTEHSCNVQMSSDITHTLRLFKKKGPEVLTCFESNFCLQALNS